MHTDYAVDPLGVVSVAVVGGDTDRTVTLYAHTVTDCVVVDAVVDVVRRTTNKNGCSDVVRDVVDGVRHPHNTVILHQPVRWHYSCCCVVPIPMHAAKPRSVPPKNEVATLSPTPGVAKCIAVCMIPL